jgi:hypothetical protein
VLLVVHRTLLSLRMATVATVATPAGSLHCQKDSYARELATTVLECAEYKAEPVAAAGKKKKKETPAGPVVPTYRVVLADSVLFPEGGGKPTPFCHYSCTLSLASVLLLLFEPPPHSTGVRVALTLLLYHCRTPRPGQPWDTGTIGDADVSP